MDPEAVPSSPFEPIALPTPTLALVPTPMLSTIDIVAQPSLSLSLQPKMMGRSIPSNHEELESIVDSLAKGLKIVSDPDYLDIHGGRTFNLDDEMMQYATLEVQDKRFKFVVSSRCHPLTKLLMQQQLPALGFVSALLPPILLR
jgi:hypothetical protein